MRYLLAVLTTFMTSIVLGQTSDDKSDKENFPKVQVGFNVSPDLSFRRLILLDDSDVIRSIYGIRNRNEIVKFGQTIGFGACLYSSRSFGFEAGIHYSNKGYHTRWNDFVIGSILERKDIYRFHYMDATVKLNFFFGKRRLRFYSSAGVTTNILWKASYKIKLKLVDGTNKDITGESAVKYRKINLSPLLGIGINYALYTKINLRIEPVVRYQMMSMTNEGINEYLLNAGVNFGVYFDF